MKFAGLAGNMWDDAGKTLLPRWSSKRGNTIGSISEDEKAKWVKATEPVMDTWIKQVKDKGLDGGKLIEQARRWWPSTTRPDDRMRRAPRQGAAIPKSARIGVSRETRRKLGRVELGGIQ